MPGQLSQAEEQLVVPAGNFKTALGALSLLILAGCDPVLTTSVAPPAQPSQSQAASNAYVPASAASQELARYYQRVQNDLLTRGLLRTDGGGPDTPYDADDLARNFETIAFVNEHSGRSGTIAGGRADVQLSRWQEPVTIMTEFGPSIPPEQRTTDREIVASYVDRLSQVTKHKIRTVSRNGNFIVFFSGLDDAAYTQARLRTLIPNIPQDRLDLIENLQRPYFCFVFTFSDGAARNTIKRAVAVIRGENPNLIRQSCIHEEIAQGLGLSNDSPAARPSIFNDDDEFALLTSHDEKLLTLLYDPRLTPGMTAQQARPVARIITRELMGQPL